MSIRNASKVFTLLTVCAAASCAVSPTEAPTEAAGAKTASRADAVINGVPDKEDKYPATILIQTIVDAKTGSAAGCTGTLVSPSVITTARHCVSAFDESRRVFGKDYDVSQMYIWVGANPVGTPDAFVEKIIHDGAASINAHDFALIVLKKPLTKGKIAPIRLTKPPKNSEMVAVAGYGLTNGTRDETSLPDRYRREGIRITAVGPLPDYDLAANELILKESICQGDSGGPVYAQATGALLAITSRGGNGRRPTTAAPWTGCLDPNVYNYFTRVDGFVEVIQAAVAEKGESLWEEGTEKPAAVPVTPPPEKGAIGSTCTTPGDCASAVCVSWAGANVCSAKCSVTAPCPTGFSCNGGYCLAGSPVEPTPETPVPSEVPPDEGAGATVTTTTKSCSVAALTGESGSTKGTGFGFSGVLLSLGLVLGVSRRSQKRSADQV